MISDNLNQHHNILKGYNMLLYFAGTMIMYEPGEECIVDFWREGILRKLPVSSSNPNFIKAASQLRESCNDKASDTSSMSEDYQRLFMREILPLAPHFESFYSSDSSNNDNHKKSPVGEFYDSYGWKHRSREEKKDDHLGVELLFLTILVEKYLVLDDEACRDEMRNEINRYIDSHILSWIPEWNRRVQAHSLTISYKGIGSLIVACAEDLKSILSNRKEMIGNSTYLRN
jgi:putative dimethyl sulfoxide reductase chaperone